MFKSQIESQLEFLSGDQAIQSKNQSNQGEPSLSSLNPQMMSSQGSGGFLENQKNGVNSQKFIGPVGKPRTANKAFGGISDFILFFENRNPEMKEFVKEFKDIEKMNLESCIKELQRVIVPKIDECLNLMYKKSRTRLQNKYAGLFTKTFDTLEEFYKKVFFAYTIPGFLYEKMNEFLRTEDWEQLDDLLPYTYSLFKAFLWGPTGFTFSQNFEFLKSMSNENKLILYRGADFDDDSLKFYNPSKIKYFSWNGVISTSLDKNIARDFQNGSSAKKPVLITIEVDFTNLNPQDLNALYLEDVSNRPKEREVALPPGSIFELLNKSEEAGSEVVISLKLVTNTKDLAQKGHFMHGMLQAVMGEEDGLKVICLRGKELSRAIKHCKGNSLIRKFEFSLCNFNRYGAELLMDMLPTMKSLKSVTFNSVIFEGDCCLGKILECLGKKGLTKLEIVDSLRDDDSLKSLIGCLKFFGSLENLKLGFQENHKISDNLIWKLKNEVSQYLDIKCIFELSFLNAEEATIKGLRKNNCPQILEPWLEGKQPTNFCFFQEKQESSLEGNVLELGGVKNRLGYSFEKDSHVQKSTLREALEEKFPEQSGVSEKPLEELTLIFEASESVFGRDFQSLECKGIECLQSITTLNLSFEYGFKITDKVLQILSDNMILQLKGLSSLHLNFNSCFFMNNEGLKVLPLHGIALNLSFNGFQMTQKELWDLGVRGITEMRSLISLHINFNSHGEAIDEQLENLFYSSVGRQNLELLSDLHLSFDYCFITDKGLEILSDKGLKNLKDSLKTLNIAFEMCEKITDKGVEVLCSQGIQFLQKLNILCLKFKIRNFGKPSGIITNKGLKYMGFDGIKHLPELKRMDLNFDGCSKITSEGIQNLCIGGIQHLEKLTDLHLSFRDCMGINDEGLQLLSREGISHLKDSLNRLELDFSWCVSLSDVGLMDLWSAGIQNLPLLSTLSLKFDNCPKMSKGELFASQIKLLKLPQCKLSFGNSSEKDDSKVCLSNNQNAVSVLCQDRLEFYDRKKGTFLEEEKFQQDQMIENLTLKFEEKHMGYLDLSQSIFNSGKMKIFNNLKTLDLNFDFQQITDLTLQNLCSEGLQHFKSLTLLHLSFCGCRSITDQGLQSLTSAGIKHLKSLANLHLKFNECCWITDKGIEALGEIQHLELMDTLYLEFEGCQKISDEGSMNLYCSRIRSLRFLTSLFLNLDYKLTDEAINKWCDLGIKHLESSKSMHLILRLRDTLRREILDFQGMKSPDSISLSFYTETKTTEILKEQILQSSSSVMIRSSNKSNKIGLAKSKLWRPDIGIQKSSSEIKLANRDSVEIVANLKFTRYLGTNHYLLKTYTRDGEYRDAFNLYENLNNIFEIIKTDIIALVFLSNSTEFEEKAKEYIRKLPAQDLTYLQSLTSLDITLRQLKQSLAEFTFNLLCFEVFPRLESLTFLHLKFDGCLRKKSIEITDDELKNISSQGIKYLKSLTTLHLYFEQCHGITDVGFTSLLADGIQNLDSLTTLELSFKHCPQITGKGFRTSQCQYPKSLSRLHLNFECCLDFTDEGVENICIGMIEHLEKLTTLHLRFENCDGVTDDGFKYLSQGISDLKLEILSLDLNQNWSITSRGIQHLRFTDAKSLRALHLNFGQCHKLTDQALKALMIKNLKSLETLNLCFDKCRQITDEGIKDLFSNEIQPLPLKQLKTLRLSFAWCDNLTEKGVESLINNGIKHLDELANLHLCFTACKQVSMAQLSSLQNLIHSFNLPHLTCPLTLNDYKTIFSEPNSSIRQEIADGKIVKDMPLKLQSHLSAADFIQKNRNCYAGGMQHAKDLETLKIVFDHFEGPKNPKLPSLCYGILQQIRSLKKLHISFEKCWEIPFTDRELKIISDGIQHLGDLTHLHLSFDSCGEITDEGLLTLSSKGIQNLKQLNILHLRFNDCRNVTDAGLAGLCSNGIQNLFVLNTLHLKFDKCLQITDEVLKSISLKVISNLPSIKNLELSFLDCPKISNASYQAFLKILSYFGYIAVE